MRLKRLVPLGIVLATLGVVVGCFAQSALKSAAAPKNPVDEGRGLFQSECVTCHGDKGDRIPVAPLNSRDFLDSRGDVTLAAIISEGKGVMPAWGKILNDDQLWQVTTFLSHMDKLPPAIDQESFVPLSGSAHDLSELGAGSQSGHYVARTFGCLHSRESSRTN